MQKALCFKWFCKVFNLRKNVLAICFIWHWKSIIELLSMASSSLNNLGFAFRPILEAIWWALIAFFFFACLSYPLAPRRRCLDRFVHHFRIIWDLSRIVLRAFCWSLRRWWVSAMRKQVGSAYNAEQATDFGSRKVRCGSLKQPNGLHSRGSQSRASHGV